jgi:hypothetical protein
MRKYYFFIAISLLVFSCKTEQAESSKVTNPNRFEKEWTLFQDAAVNNTAFDWNNFVEIEGQFGEDYIYLFQSEEALETIKKTKYNQLYDATLFNEPVKQLTIGSFEEFTRPEGHVFYFKETNRGLKLIAFDAL